MTIDELMAVLQAAKESKKIQRKGYAGNWYSTDMESIIAPLELRVAPPEPREIWLYEYPGGILGYHYTFKELEEVAEPQRSRLRHFREVIE